MQQECLGKPRHKLLFEYHKACSHLSYKTLKKHF